MILITGKGPQRAAFEREAMRLPSSRIHLRTLWLPYRDYQRLLGAVHLGLCLHRSSSKVDLPMKIMDIFGAGLPVCALDYGPCLAEQVQHGVNGLLFDGPAELKKQLCELFSSFPTDTRYWTNCASASSVAANNPGMRVGRNTHERGCWLLIKAAYPSSKIGPAKRNFSHWLAWLAGANHFDGHRS